MARKRRTVQAKKRRKVYQPGAFSGEATELKKRGVFRVFSNYTLFAIIGAFFIGGGVILSALNVGGGSGTRDTSGDVIRSEIEREGTAEPGSTPAPDDGVRSFTAPEQVVDPAKTYTATIKTDKGDIHIELLPQEAPEAVNSFVFLARQNFYDGVTFHRVIDDFIAQAGDPTGSGSGGPGYSLIVENTDVPVEAGVVGIVRPERAGALNNGSQFAIVLGDTYASTLDGNITVIGRLASERDLEVARSLTQRDPQTEEAPAPGDRIVSVEIAES